MRQNLKVDSPTLVHIKFRSIAQRQRLISKWGMIRAVKTEIRNPFFFSEKEWIFLRCQEGKLSWKRDCCNNRLYDVGEVANAVQPSGAVVVRSFHLDSISDHCVHPALSIYISGAPTMPTHNKFSHERTVGPSRSASGISYERRKVSETRFLSSRKRQRRLSRRRKPPINHAPWIYEGTLLLAILQTGRETRKPSRWTMIDRSCPPSNL